MCSFTDLITNSIVCLDNGSQTNMMKYGKRNLKVVISSKNYLDSLLAKIQK
ncbi:MAG TPA: hypothetical protein VE244_06590 [Nitrososphaeraceae archaeon]|nr:hypothetical protein [Nitrososphaeraceae archaeon]